ncbi:MAG: NTP transferase domain-containing protein, partial [Acidimicrobiales bacterium]|nr:NTP transferase domain-containing protein [Acidimicrobiales bacterium]
MTQRAAALVLAAGAGARMRSTRPKPVHLLCGRPMVVYVLDALLDIAPRRAVVVVGRGAEVVTKKVAAAAPDLPLTFVEQRVARGTGDAVAVGLTAFEDDFSVDDSADDVIVVPGDMPLLRGSTITGLLEHHRADNNAATLLAAPSSDTTVGRHLIRGRDDKLVAVYDDAISPEVATGVGIYRRSLLAPAI